MFCLSAPPRRHPATSTCRSVNVMRHHWHARPHRASLSPPASALPPSDTMAAFDMSREEEVVEEVVEVAVVLVVALALGCAQAGAVSMERVRDRPGVAVRDGAAEAQRRGAPVPLMTPMESGLRLRAVLICKCRVTEARQQKAARVPVRGRRRHHRACHEGGGDGVAPAHRAGSV
jgi:hypothetical protein